MIFIAFLILHFILKMYVHYTITVTSISIYPLAFFLALSLLESRRVTGKVASVNVSRYFFLNKKQKINKIVEKKRGWRGKRVG